MNSCGYFSDVLVWCTGGSGRVGSERGGEGRTRVLAFSSKTSRPGARLNFFTTRIRNREHFHLSFKKKKDDKVINKPHNQVAPTVNLFTFPMV